MWCQPSAGNQGGRVVFLTKSTILIGGCLVCRIVFTSRKKTIKNGEIVQKKFVLSEDTFVFGPLLCGKTRER